MKEKKFDNSEIQKRVDDIEKELNNLQEKSFNRELVTNTSRRSQEQLLSGEASCTIPDPAVHNAKNNRPQNFGNCINQWINNELCNQLLEKCRHTGG